MAAVSELRMPELVDIRGLRPADLDGILDHEIRDWRAQLDWDFRPSADLVRRFVNMRALNGYALVAGGDVAGYCYFVCEERKGLIGDIYLLEEYRTVENENRLLAAVLENLMGTPHIHRVESQLMLLRPAFDRPLPFPELLARHPRNFMAIGAAEVRSLKPGPAGRRMLFETWSDRRQDEAAHLIAAAYEGHVDSAINDQYRSPGGARRFLTNIVQFPGCGAFFQAASYLAIDPMTDRLSGLSLASLLAADVGHITQICVAPGVRGTGLGYELLRRSLVSLAAHGCRKASLTVTADNRTAVELYERIGFRTARTFAALVWEGW